MSSFPDRSPHPHRPQSAKQPSSPSLNQTVGWLAEELVAQWLVQQGGEILQRRWHCRWGELDLVVQLQTTLAFVEVKARRGGNWDLDGLLAITPQKQQKLWKTAELFLSNEPQLADLPCRFDVALVHVHSHRSKNTALGDRSSSVQTAFSNEWLFPEPIEIGKPVTSNGYSLSLQHYIPSAFDLI